MIFKMSLLITDSLFFNIALGPVSVLGGIGFGVLWGLILKYFPEKGDVSLFFYLNSNSQTIP